MQSTLQQGEDQNQIGLNDLLMQYLGPTKLNTKKDKVIALMKQDPEFWHN